jgi:polyisoprenoid-binding protein YceI
MTRFLTAAILATATLCAPAAFAQPKAATPPAGAYVIDPSHTSVTFRVSHLGFSNYTGHFKTITGNLTFDPAKPEAMSVEASIDPRSLEIPSPPAGFVDTLLGKSWFDAAAWPAITFRSTKVTLTGEKTAKVTGDFTLHGVTKPVTLDVTFNGGWPANPMDGARIGFSATAAFKRSEFGMGFGVPAPGTTMGVSDEVQVAIETEFSGGGGPKAH